MSKMTARLQQELHKQYISTTHATKHATTRMKERSGIQKAQADKMAKRALEHGIEYEYTMGDLKRWIDNRKLEKGNFARYYGDLLYIFSSTKQLITALPASDGIRRALKYEVQEERYHEYCRYRKSLHREEHKPKKETKRVAMEANSAKRYFQRHFDENDIKLTVTKVEPWGRSNNYTIHYTSDFGEKGWIFYVKKVQQWAKTHDMKIYLQYDNPNLQEEEKKAEIVKETPVKEPLVKEVSGDGAKMRERLVQCRKLYGFSPQSVANMLQLPSKEIVSDWETGKVKPSEEDIALLSCFYECSKNWLLGFEDKGGPR